MPVSGEMTVYGLLEGLEFLHDQVASRGIPQTIRSNTSQRDPERIAVGYCAHLERPLSRAGVGGPQFKIM